MVFYIIGVRLKNKNYSIFSIFPYFVLGFIGMIVVRNIGDQIFTQWKMAIMNFGKLQLIISKTTVFLTMAIAVGISILNELKA